MPPVPKFQLPKAKHYRDYLKECKDPEILDRARVVKPTVEDIEKILKYYKAPRWSTT